MVRWARSAGDLHAMLPVVATAPAELVCQQSDRDETTELALTQQGVVVGTTDYLAPEQARARVPSIAGPTCTALAAPSITCLRGNRCSPAARLWTRSSAISRMLLPRCRTLRPDVPPDLQAVIRQAAGQETRRPNPDGCGGRRRPRTVCRQGCRDPGGAKKAHPGSPHDPRLLRGVPQRALTSQRRNRKPPPHRRRRPRLSLGRFAPRATGAGGGISLPPSCC